MSRSRPWKAYVGGKIPRPAGWRAKVTDALRGGSPYVYDGPDIREDHYYLLGRWIPDDEAWMWVDDHGHLARSQAFQDAHAVAPARPVARSLSGLVGGADIVIADVRTREMLDGPFPDVEAARAARSAMADPGHSIITTAAWLEHLTQTPAQCGPLALVPAESAARGDAA